MFEERGLGGEDEAGAAVYEAAQVALREQGRRHALARTRFSVLVAEVKGPKAVEHDHRGVWVVATASGERRVQQLARGRKLKGVRAPHDPHARQGGLQGGLRRGVLSMTDPAQPKAAAAAFIRLHPERTATPK